MNTIVERMSWTLMLVGAGLIMAFPEILGSALKLVVSILISIISSLVGR